VPVATKEGSSKEGSSSTKMPPDKRLCENAEYHRLQPRGVSVSTWRAKQQRFLDIIDFSRVVFQFQPGEQNSRDS
jgi:hypothetical protein